MKKIINFIWATAILLILFCMAYYGLSFAINLPPVDFIDSFGIFYSIFSGFDIATIALTLPLLLGIIASITFFAEKNFKLVFLFIEIALLIVIFLHGFGVI